MPEDSVDTYTLLTNTRKLSASIHNDTPWKECGTLEGFVNYHTDRPGGTEEFQQWLARRIN